MPPFASVAMLEKLALLKIALCKAPVFSRASACCTSISRADAGAALFWLSMFFGKRGFGPLLSWSIVGCGHRGHETNRYSAWLPCGPAIDLHRLSGIAGARGRCRSSPAKREDGDRDGEKPTDPERASQAAREMDRSGVHRGARRWGPKAMPMTTK